MDRGIPGQRISAPGEYVEEDFFLTRHVSLDSDGFSLSTATLTGHSGLPQPKGIDLRPGREEKGVLHNAAILSRVGNNSTQIAAAPWTTQSTLPKVRNKCKAAPIRAAIRLSRLTHLINGF